MKKDSNACGKCAVCGGEIFKGEYIITDGAEAVHYDCRLGLTINQLLKQVDLKPDDPIRYADEPGEILKAFGLKEERA